MTNDLMACLACRALYQTERDALVAACASVGIEHGYTAAEALRIYLACYHRDGHREPEPTAGVGRPEPEPQ